ncbi:MAG: hypothetical protein WC315_09525, partial [Candidatus Omnitrophota bacterium]
MDKPVGPKILFLRICFILPLIYIGLGWYIGLNYSSKPLIFGPYPDIPMVMKTKLLGSSVEDISGAKALVTVVPLEKINKFDPNSTYFKIAGYFELPGVWLFDSSLDGKSSLSRRILLTGNHSQAIAHGLKNPKRKLGNLSIREFNDFLKATGRTKDAERLKPYLVLSKLEEKYPWLYSETVLLSKAMGNVFSDNFIPYDVLGLVGIGVLLIALSVRSFGLWLYFLYWVLSYWFGRIGFHDPNLAASNEGWQIILWGFWHGFIQKEGRLFLVVAFILSIIAFTIFGFLYLTKHILPRKRRETEDFFKIDKDIEKRKELSIENIEFKKVNYDISKKLKQYIRTDKYFLGFSDEKKDIVVDENILTYHMHVLGPTGSGKTSLVILPLSKQAIEKDRGCCFIDFKGDEVFKRYVQQKAKEKGKRFYYFSIDPNEP